MDNFNNENLLDTSADDLEMEKLNKEFEVQSQKSDEQLTNLRDISQKIESDYQEEMSIINKYCDDVTKLVGKYEIVEENKVARYKGKKRYK